MADIPAAKDVQNEVLSTVRKSQEGVIDAIKTWVETVQSITSRIVAMSFCEPRSW